MPDRLQPSGIRPFATRARPEGRWSCGGTQSLSGIAGKERRARTQTGPRPPARRAPKPEARRFCQAAVERLVTPVVRLGSFIFAAGLCLDFVALSNRKVCNPRLREDRHFPESAPAPRVDLAAPTCSMPPTPLNPD